MSNKRGRVGWVLVALAAAPCQLARSQAGVAGTYRASPRETRVEVSTWGADCGPRPQNDRDGARAAIEVREQGSHLAFGFPDRTLRTDACWSPNPAVRVASASAASGRWRTECLTPAGDPKRERGVYTVVASSNDSLELVEESEYDWQLNESHCVAKLRSVQRLARGAAADEAAREGEPAACTPGPLARIRLRPSEARIGPGERVCFNVRGLDAEGCPTAADPSLVKWSLSKPEAASGTLAGGCFKAAASAAEAEGRFQIAAAIASARAEAVVTVAPTDLSDITARRGTSASELDAEGERGGIISDLGIEAAVEGTSLGMRLLLAALSLLLLASLALLLVRRAQKHARPAGLASGHDALRATPSAAPRARPAAGAAQASARPPPAPASPAAGEQLICPVCRRGYAPGTARCANDGSPLLAYAEFVRRAQAAEAGPSTCAECGAQMTPGALFCGECGQRVRR